MTKIAFIGAGSLGFTYNLATDRTTVLRGGYGRFYDKTHYELITGIITAGVFSDSFIVNFPASGVDAGPSQGRAPTNPYLVDGPTVNRQLLILSGVRGLSIRFLGGTASPAIIGSEKRLLIM